MTGSVERLSQFLNACWQEELPIADSRLPIRLNQKKTAPMAVGAVDDPAKGGKHFR
jgi:hypothetical protein